MSSLEGYYDRLGPVPNNVGLLLGTDADFCHLSSPPPSKMPPFRNNGWVSGARIQSQKRGRLLAHPENAWDSGIATRKG